MNAVSEANPYASPVENQTDMHSATRTPKGVALMILVPTLLSISALAYSVWCVFSERETTWTEPGWSSQVMNWFAAITISIVCAIISLVTMFLARKRADRPLLIIGGLPMLLLSTLPFLLLLLK